MRSIAAAIAWWSGRSALNDSDRGHRAPAARHSPLCGGRVFIDLGANRGDTVGAWYSRSAGFRTLLSSLPNQDPWTYCVSSFEANPRWTPGLLKLQRTLAPRAAARGGALKIFNDTAASTNDTVLDLYLDTSREAGGSTIVKDKVVPAKHRGKKPVRVRAIDFPAFLEKATLRKAKRPQDARVIVKFDVEGAEYEIFDALFARGTLCDRVDVAVVEFHAAKIHSARLPKDVDDRIRNRLGACGVEVWEYGGRATIGTSRYGLGDIERTVEASR
mmetsp:Transcript_29060/g.86797  ORF Transcript_29060/g.86797 Transcript_29060/m.86797 type:complete len:273 (+) Transcript_29060:250-1068(+)